MPKLRPWVGQKFANLGPAGFQDAVWKCSKCQKKCDTPLFCFHFLLSWSSFPLVSFIVSTFPPWGGLSSTWAHLFPGKALLCAEWLHLLLVLLPPLWLPDLSFHYASVDHTQNFYCLLLWPWDWALPLLSASRAHGSIILSLGKDTSHIARPGHSISWALLFCGHFIGLPFIKPHVFSKCVPLMAAGYSETLRCPDPECHQERVRE